jgi:hypothetical protein
LTKSPNQSIIAVATFYKTRIYPMAAVNNNHVPPPALQEKGRFTCLTAYSDALVDFSRCDFWSIVAKVTFLAAPLIAAVALIIDLFACCFCCGSDEVAPAGNAWKPLKGARDDFSLGEKKNPKQKEAKQVRSYDDWSSCLNLAPLVIPPKVEDVTEQERQPSAEADLQKDLLRLDGEQKLLMPGTDVVQKTAEEKARIAAETAVFNRIKAEILGQATDPLSRVIKAANISAAIQKAAAQKAAEKPVVADAAAAQKAADEPADAVAQKAADEKAIADAAAQKAAADADAAQKAADEKAVADAAAAQKAADEKAAAEAAAAQKAADEKAAAEAAAAQKAADAKAAAPAQANGHRPRSPKRIRDSLEFFTRQRDNANKPKNRAFFQRRVDALTAELAAATAK